MSSTATSSTDGRNLRTKVTPSAAAVPHLPLRLRTLRSAIRNGKVEDDRWWEGEGPRRAKQTHALSKLCSAHRHLACARATRGSSFLVDPNEARKGRIQTPKTRTLVPCPVPVAMLVVGGGRRVAVSLDGVVARLQRIKVNRHRWAYDVLPGCHLTQASGLTAFVLLLYSYR